MTKNDLRADARRRRASLPSGEKEAADASVVKHILESPLYRDADAVLLYAPRKSEINLLPLIRSAREAGKAVAFPKCDESDGTMRFLVLSPGNRLTPGAYGIPEPDANEPECRITGRTLCLVPGLTFDRSGNRLGYGKGYYDRFLSSFPGVSVGVVNDVLISECVPAEKHDVPVTYLVSESGIFPCAEPESPPKRRRFAGLAEFGAQVKRAMRRTILNDDGTESDREDTVVTAALRVLRARWKELPKPLKLPPLLVLCTFILLLLSRVVETLLLDRGNEFAAVILLQIVIFAVPAFLYTRLRGEKFPSRIRLSPVRPEHLPFLFFVLLLMITGSLLTGILTGGIASLEGNFTLYSTFVARPNGEVSGIIGVVITYCFLPALCEELVFRSILCAEYERFGVGTAVTVSTVFFAMLHFTLPNLLTYLFLGALLSSAMYATRSSFGAFLLHLFYNAFCLFGQPYLSGFYVNAGSHEIFLFCLVTLFLLSAALSAGEGRKIYHVYAMKNADSSYTPKGTFRRTPWLSLRMLSALPSLACVAVWVVTLVVTAVLASR